VEKRLLSNSMPEVLLLEDDKHYQKAQSFKWLSIGNLSLSHWRDVIVVFLLLAIANINLYCLG